MLLRRDTQGHGRFESKSMEKYMYKDNPKQKTRNLAV